MSAFLKKKSSLEEEDLCCCYCEYAQIGDGEQVFCKKKKKDVAAEGNCLSFVYDLLKRRPPKRKSVDLSDLDFPRI